MKNQANKKSGAASTKRESTTKAKASGKPAPDAKKLTPAKAGTVLLKPSVEAVPSKKSPSRAGVADERETPRALKDKERSKDGSGNGALRGRTKRESPPSPAAASIPEEPPRKVETYLNAKQLAEFRELLLDKRSLLTGDVERLADQALNRKEHGFNEQSTMPIHMADLGSDTWEQDFNLGLLANEQGVVREIDDALRRIEDRTYGICLATDARITVARLRAKPWAKYCIEYERAREEGRLP